MPDNKNQHYVPQFYLKNFTSSESKRCINILNIDRDRVILNASLRDQCSKGYFYGKDSVLDALLTGLEGISSAEIRSLIAGEVMERASILLRLFISVQKGRTLYAVEQAYSLVVGMQAELAKHSPAGEQLPKFPTKDEMKDINIKQHVLLYPMLMDLSSALLVNATAIDFITSDNPVVLCNRFYKDNHLSGSGLAKAGIEIYLPVSPRLVVLLYDGYIWHAPERLKDGTITITRANWVDSVNELQILNAQSNLYFADDGDAKDISDLFAKVKERRRSGDATVETYFSVDEDAQLFVQDELVGKSSRIMFKGGVRDLDVTPRIEFLKKSIRPKASNDGSARGPVRDEAWCDIVNDFSHDVIGGKASLADIDLYARRHPLAGRIRPRKASATQL